MNKHTIICSAFCGSGKTYICNNPGTVNSSCATNTEKRLVESCNHGCKNEKKWD